MLRGIHHVAIICSDYPRSKSFYCDTLGLAIINEQYRASRDSYKLDLALPDGGQLELFSFPDPPKRRSNPEAQGLRHLAFVVEDLEAARETAIKAGAAPRDIVDFRPAGETVAKFFFVADPDGYQIEVIEKDGRFA